MAEVTGEPRTGFAGWLERQGIVRSLAWGYVALLLFMVGDGIELGFLGPYLESRGFGAAGVATLISVYGVVVAVAAWLAGALAEAWGPRRVMLIGFTVWVAFEIVFLGFGVVAGNYEVMLLSYGVRGIGYPFFAYGFLVWVTMDTPKAVIGRAVGWYWFASTAGLGVLSSYFAGAVIPLVGELATMWLSLVFVAAGGVIVLFLVRTRRHEAEAGAWANLRQVARGLTVVRTHPKVGLGGVVRIINTLCFYAFPVFLASHMVNEVGFSLPQWQTIWGTMLFANIIGNVLAGYLGDRIGPVNVVAWFGGLGCVITVLGMYYLPEWLGPNFPVAMIAAILLGLAMAAYVPLSAIVPLLAPTQKAAAVAILNLGAGLSNATGPLLARAFLGPFGVGGMMWLLAGLYAVGIALTFGLRAPELESADADETLDVEGSSGRDEVATS
ncbi:MULTISPECIES: MFS transporter [Prauserella salsuginis group]|uniref:MFS transporter n=1 Tax=Prauserella salsuginis TaxID=387889 RepID=A0ABW6G3F6_9PSEU|nr:MULTISPECIES: MFS transporter [Prauserella salsuginis group]MCR3718624.1 polyol permease family [Prauserella flava]MCR3733194.1 polyol permease family [Prauserella salsuginis]